MLLLITTLVTHFAFNKALQHFKNISTSLDSNTPELNPIKSDVNN